MTPGALPSDTLSNSTKDEVDAQLDIMHIMGAWDAIDGTRPRWVYFAERGGLIKIGSSNQVAARMRALETNLLAVCLGGFETERATHLRFAEYSLGHEWFADVPPLREYIAALPSPALPGPRVRPAGMADTLSLPEVAKVLGRSHQTIWRQAKATGEVLPGVKVFKIGSRNRVSRIQVDEFLSTGRVAS